MNKIKKIIFVLPFLYSSCSKEYFYKNSNQFEPGTITITSDDINIKFNLIKTAKNGQFKGTFALNDSLILPAIYYSSNAGSYIQKILIYNTEKTQTFYRLLLEPRKEINEKTENKFSMKCKVYWEFEEYKLFDINNDSYFYFEYNNNIENHILDDPFYVSNGNWHEPENKINISFIEDSLYGFCGVNENFKNEPDLIYHFSLPNKISCYKIVDEFQNFSCNWPLEFKGDYSIIRNDILIDIKEKKDNSYLDKYILNRGENFNFTFNDLDFVNTTSRWKIGNPVYAYYGGPYHEV